MKFKPTILTLILIGLLSICQKNLSAQNHYQNLTFLEFLNQKVENDTNFVRQLYMNLKFPLQARMYDMEGIVEFRIIIDDEKNCEISMVGLDWPFTNGITEIKKAVSQTKINRSQPFVTTLFVNYGYDAKEIQKASKDLHLWLYKNNTISIVEFKFPDKWFINGIWQYVAGIYKFNDKDVQNKLILKNDSTFVLTTFAVSPDQIIPNGMLSEIRGKYSDHGDLIKLYPSKSRLAVSTYKRNLKVVNKLSFISGNLTRKKTSLSPEVVVMGDFQKYESKVEIDLKKKVDNWGLALQNEKYFFYRWVR